ncbi:hypothetical protein DFO45_4844 [Azorhizobium sp. AG788]|jgi:hypothetical protein|nr:hypothetical protein DFO45_4844 [Azorhizobium sp. AG788]
MTGFSDQPMTVIVMGNTSIQVPYQPRQMAGGLGKRF